MNNAAFVCEIVSGIDQGEMGKTLRKISQLAPVDRVIFFGQKTDIVAQVQ